MGDVEEEERKKGEASTFTFLFFLSLGAACSLREGGAERGRERGTPEASETGKAFDKAEGTTTGFVEEKTAESFD